MRKLFLILGLYMLSFSSVFAGLFISAVFPNTVDDKNLEYIQIVNSLYEFKKYKTILFK